MTVTMEQWATRVAPGMTAEQWRTAELIVARGWDASCGAWLEWVQGTAPPRGRHGLPPWGLHLAQALLDWRRAGDPRGTAGDRCESGNECGRAGCPECQQ